MTRETKLGVAIAGTFLTIAGSWLGVKLSRGEPATPEEAPAATAAENPGESQPQALADASATAAPAAESAPQPAATPTQTPVAAATPEATPSAAPAPIKPDADAVVQSATTSAPAPAPVAVPAGDPPPPSIPLQPMPDQPAPVAVPIAAPIITPSAPATSEPPATPSPSPMPITTPAPITDPPPPVVAPPPPPVETRKDPEQPPAATIITKPADAPPTAPVPTPITEPSVAIVPTSPGAATLGPPGGAAPVPFSTANNARPAAEPRAQSYLEEEYRWQPGDGFGQVSQRFYNSDKYAAALQQYNREYPLAGANMRRNPPTVAPGQVIWVPPVRILERDYPAMVAGVQPLNDRGMPATGGARPADGAVLSSASTASQLYRVRERGETMYEIARRTLGDSGKWVDVSRQNPSLARDPRLPIPAGTVLRLPGEAKLEPADKP